MAKKKIVLAEEKDVVKDDGVDVELAPEESETDQQIDIETTEEETGSQEEIPAEVEAMSTDNDTAKEMNKAAKAEKTAEKSDKKKTKAKKSKQGKKAQAKKQKSKKYLEAEKDLDKSKLYPVKEGIELVKTTSYAKFDATITIDIRLAKPKKGEDMIRGTVKLPHPTGKTSKIEIASDALIEKIKKGYADFDLLIATPEMMPKLAQVAKILGPKGKMPNPKDGTVVDDPSAAVEELNSVARYRADGGRNLHLSVGKKSLDSTKIEENIAAVLKALAHLKKESITLSATMGPGIKISI